MYEYASVSKTHGKKHVNKVIASEFSLPRRIERNRYHNLSLSVYSLDHAPVLTSFFCGRYLIV